MSIDQYLEYKRPSGEMVTLASSPNGGYDVDMWKPNDDNHWNRWYRDYDKAKAEYDKWAQP